MPLRWRRSGASGRCSSPDVPFPELEQNAFPVLVLGIGKERYGIELPDVAEVLPPIRPTPVPGAAADFAGVINVHGEIRPVIDLRRYLGIRPGIQTGQTGIQAGMAGAETFRSGAPARVILLRKEGRELGLQIDSVEQIRWIASGELQSGANSCAERSRHIKGSTRDLLMLLSTETLFAELQAANLETGVTT